MQNRDVFRFGAAAMAALPSLAAACNQLRVAEQQVATQRSLGRGAGCRTGPDAVLGEIRRHLRGLESLRASLDEMVAGFEAPTVAASPPPHRERPERRIDLTPLRWDAE
jgi:hypothetical protein